MADDLRMALTNLLRKAEMAGDVDFLRDGVRILGQTLMDLEVSQHLRAEKNERTPERTGHRNGYSTRQWDTRVGTVDLQVPRVRDGSFFPSLLEPRRRAERALVGVGDDGGGHDPDGLRPTGSGRCEGSVAPGGGLLPWPLSPPGGVDGRSGRRRAGVRDVPGGALAADLVEQSAGAVEQGDQAAHERRGDLPEPRFDRPPGRLCALRAT